MGARDIDRDPGELFEGDQCPTEFKRTAPRVWHPSFMDAVLRPLPPVGDKSIERRCVDTALSILKKKSPTPAARPRAPKLLTCWKTTPQPLRELIVSVAGLGLDVVRKIDRDLTEEEKAALRRAIGKIRDRLNPLVAL